MGEKKSQEDAALAETQRVVCFSETPLEHAWMMCSDIDWRGFQFSGHGVAFTRRFARRKGANPVWYLDMTPSGHEWLTKAVNDLMAGATVLGGSFAVVPPIFRLTPFIEQMGTWGERRKEFWWEREWRYVGDFIVEPSDLVAVLAPYADHDQVGKKLSSGPSAGRTIALLDPNWGLERMIAALAGVAESGPFPGV
jgi:hypothetical protein